MIERIIMDSSKTFQTLLGLMVLFMSSILMVYIILKRRYMYWKKRGVPGPEPSLIFGNFKDLFLSRATEAEIMNEICKKFEDEKFIGLYYLWSPVLLMRDLDLVKKITESDFQFFTDHPEITGKSEVDSVSNSLFMMKGSVWKERRLYFSKLFTPKKIKEYSLDLDCGLKKLMMDVELCAKSNEDVEAIRFFEKYTIHSIASSMYGLDLSEDDQNTSKFARIANLLIHPPMVNIIKIILHTVLPGLCNAFRMSTHPSEIWHYISKFADGVFKGRQNNSCDRMDLVSLLMKLMSDGSSNIKRIDFKEAIGHFFAFFQAGHHTTEVTMSHVLLRLSQNSDVQDTLRDEVKNLIEDGGVPTYESLMKMHYLHGVIYESLRMKPALGAMKRICTKPYQLKEDLEIPLGMVIYLPVEYLQNRAEYFPQPEEMKPERFGPGSTDHPAFMPFGRGPRLCIGMRFAELEMKKAIAAIVARYEILPSDKMKFPLVYDSKTLFFTNIPIGGVWVKFRKLENEK